jgi:hypothetical protein
MQRADAEAAGGHQGRSQGGGPPNVDLPSEGRVYNVRVSSWLAEHLSNGGGGPGAQPAAAPSYDEKVPYVIVGHGVAGAAALRALLLAEPSAEVVVVEARQQPDASGAAASDFLAGKGR